MCRLLLTLIASAAFVLGTTPAEAGHRSHSYPKVRTFSGGYYGPTQANYQYQRRYGHSWHGQGGFHGHHGVGYVNGYPGGSFSYSRSWGWPSIGYGASFGYGPSYGYGSTYGYGGLGFGFGGLGSSASYYSPYFGSGYGGYGGSPYVNSPYTSYPFGATYVQPTLIPQSPGIYTPLPSLNPLANDALQNNGYLWQQEVPDLVTPGVETLNVEPLGNADVPLQSSSTPEAQLRSVQHQQHGDARLRDLDYLQAYLRYKDAVAAAPDRAEPHYRMGIALVGMKRFDKAVRELKTATALDPTWVDAVSLLDLIGEDNLIGKTQLKQRVADWALEDAHDADRLYLLGALLHLDGDEDRAQVLFDTAIALVGNEPYLSVFNNAQPILPAGHQEPARVRDSAPTDIPAPPAISAPPALPTPPTQSEETTGLPSLPAPSGPTFPTELQ